MLSASRVGRLGCVRDGMPYIVPISYVYEERHIYSFSLVGAKVSAMRGHPQVCLEIDKIESPRQWWSVVACGYYEELPENPTWRGEREYAWSLLQKSRPNWWEPGSTNLSSDRNVVTTPHLFFRIEIELISGRRGSI